MESVLQKLGRNKITSDDSDSISTDVNDCHEGGEDVFDNHSTGDADKDENKSKTISIDITKALVILGFSNWTELEKGVKHHLYKL